MLSESSRVRTSFSSQFGGLVISALLLIGAFTFEARSLPSRAYRHCIKSAISWWVSAFASSELHGYYEHAKQLTLALWRSGGSGWRLAMAVSWVAGNESELQTGAMYVCRIPTNLPNLKPIRTRTVMLRCCDVAFMFGHLATCVTCVSAVSAAWLPGCSAP